MANQVRVSQVFVAGGQPSLTYVDREGVDAESTLADEVREYLDEGHKALTVTGPTKSGKTVLCRNVISTNAGVWTSGGNIEDEEDFWTQVAEQIDLSSGATETVSNVDSSSQMGELAGEGGLPFLAKASAKGSLSESQSFQTAKSSTKITNNRMRTMAGLVNSRRPLVTDDFHYIDREVQKKVVRALKAPIFDGLRVILIAVPHRAFDAVRSEREMTGRVDQISVRLWMEDELRGIPKQGFPLLNVTCDELLIADFLAESQGSPHLMQEFCKQLCKTNDVKSTSDSVRALSLPDRVQFYKTIAASTAKPAFDLLARGPRQRSDRKQRRFVGGGTGDIYLAVLRAIAHRGAVSRMTYEDIRAALRQILDEEIPQAHEVTRVLVKMTTIAKDRIEGEAVIEWDEEENVLHIADPFFAFYLRWFNESTAFGRATGTVTNRAGNAR